MADLQGDWLEKIENRACVIGIIGLGYVGIPLAFAAFNSRFRVIGFDIDATRVEQLNAGQISIKHIPEAPLRQAIADELFQATGDFDDLAKCDAILIAVPTPLTKHREPDLSFVEATSRDIAKRLRKGQLVVLESTTWPGTTNEIIKPILEATGLKSGQDFLLAFSPEREDPGNADHGTSTIPKVVGGDGIVARNVASAVYGAFLARTVPVSSPATAEAVKLTENIFRAVNIALVNELKVVYEKMGIDVWEVIDAAATKPFGFMPFYPGPGLGGHCIPIDPFYLTWKSREFEMHTRFIELAGEINSAMPAHVVTRLAEVLDRQKRRGLNGARILVIGVAYKKNVDDMRESPSLRLIELLEDRGASVDYHDDHIPIIPRTREHAQLAGRKSQELEPEAIRAYDVVLIATDHDAIDWANLANNAQLVIDTRNALARAGITSGHIFKA